jgi:hypothetical protein
LDYETTGVGNLPALEGFAANEIVVPMEQKIFDFSVMTRNRKGTLEIEGKERITRTQFPVVGGYAATAHSSQGLTVKDVVADVASISRLPNAYGCLYSMATRAVSGDKFKILGSFPYKLLTQRPSSDLREMWAEHEELEAVTLNRFAYLTRDKKPLQPATGFWRAPSTYDPRKFPKKVLDSTMSWLTPEALKAESIGPLHVPAPNSGRRRKRRRVERPPEPNSPAPQPNISRGQKRRLEDEQMQAPKAPGPPPNIPRGQKRTREDDAAEEHPPTTPQTVQHPPSAPQTVVCLFCNEQFAPAELYTHDLCENLWILQRYKAICRVVDYFLLHRQASDD